VEKEFLCDRPFIFIVRDEETGLNLFEGKLVDPRLSEIGLFN
jgi:serine protease inhibitor